MNSIITTNLAGVSNGRGTEPNPTEAVDIIEIDNPAIYRESALLVHDSSDRIGDQDWGPDLSAHESIDDPHRLGREVLSRHFHQDGPTLVYYRGDFHIHDGAAYRQPLEFKTVELVQAVKAAIDRGFAASLRTHKPQSLDREASGKPLRPVRRRMVPKVTKPLVENVAQALRSTSAINSEADAPFWISPQPGDPNPIDIIPAANGLVDLGGDRPILFPHSPRFFSPNVLPFNYDPDAPRPKRWLAFLEDQWADDPESIVCLHEVIGYLLTADNRLHKLFLMIGPPRSGKSTIKDIITALIGERNVASCSPFSLGDTFGLEPLLGKTVAIMADARTGGNSNAMLDRLVRITGGDSVDVNRKYQPILANVRLLARFLIISNELPEFRDPSKAITARYLILRTSASIPAELRDPNLLAKLTAELPGILNLAIEGLARLRARGRFLQPSSGDDLLRAAEVLASPVAAFVEECMTRDPHGKIEKEEAYKIWKGWAEERGYEPGNCGSFGKALYAAVPGLEDIRPRVGGDQVSFYIGLKRRAI